MIEEKISMISDEKIALEDLLKRANVEFPNDEKVIKLYDSDNNDDDGGGKNDDHGSDNVGKKKESVAKDVVNAEKDRVNAEKDGVNEDLFVCPWAVQPISLVCPQTPQRVVTSSSPNKKIVKPPNYFTSPYMNKRTKVTLLIRGLSLCWVIACLQCKAISRTIDEEQQWKVFSDEISAQFEHDVSYISLFEVDLDLGLCEESDEQVSMLRRMRFKIATKILLHEINVHAKKMFHSAFKFEFENDEQTRISIIMNVIKNKDECDPAKTKTFAKNQEEDAIKNK
nr:cytochrome P450 [Tanacetum cinerariifolium]